MSSSATLATGLAATGAAASKLACSTVADSPSEALLVDRPGQTGAGADRDMTVCRSIGIKPAPASSRNAVAEREVDAILLGQDQNMVYFSGCFRRSGERSTWLLFPVQETDTAYWYAPSIDRDLMRSWWSTEMENYFCYPHAEGGFPYRGELARGQPSRSVRVDASGPRPARSRGQDDRDRFRAHRFETANSGERPSRSALRRDRRFVSRHADHQDSGRDSAHPARLSLLRQSARVPHATIFWSAAPRPRISKSAKRSKPTAST